MNKKIKINAEVMKRVIWVLTILWMGIIFYFSSQPAELSLDASGEILVQMNQIGDDIPNISIEEYGIFTILSGSLHILYFIADWAS